MGAQVPAFVVERRAGLLDFWAVYAREIEHLDEASAEVGLGLSELLPLVRPEDADRVIALAHDARVLFAQALERDDWQPYIEHIHVLGTGYAELGIGFSQFYSLLRTFHRRLIGPIVTAYAATPARLGETLIAMTELFDFWTAEIVEQYVAVRQHEERTHQLEERARQLEIANREVEAFSYSVAHDLRAPLRSVSGFTQIVLEDHAAGLEGEAIACLRKIQGGVARMTALIDALLELGQLSRSKLEVEAIDVSALARAVVAQLAAADPRRQVEVVVHGGLRVNADGRLIRTLFDNLIGNAWKFTGKTAAPRIEVGGDGRTFFVRDNGAGFDMARAGKLFTAFERLHAADEFPGTGVGLATVYRIVARHGGRIWADARVGAGATFSFTLGPA